MAKASDHEFEQVIGRLLKSIDELEGSLLQKKRLVNELCVEYEQPPRFADLDQDKGPTISSIRRDQFHGRPMATAAREYLEMRRPSDRGGLGAASINEIYAALLQGGFRFDTKNDLNAKRGLREALSKNTLAFRRVGDAYGLAEWYPKPDRVRIPKIPKVTKVLKKPAVKKTAGDNAVAALPPPRE